MKYLQRLAIRLTISVILMVLGLKLIYLILSPLTFYLSYFSLFFYSPELISSTKFIIKNYGLIFIPACTAGSAYLLLILLTTTTDLTLKKSLKVIGFGSLIIFVANLIRIDLLIVALVEKGSKLFDTLHLFFWDIISTLFVVGLWIFIIKWFKIKEIPVYSDFKKIIRIYKKSKNIN